MAKVRVSMVSLLCILCAFCNRTVGGGLAHVATPMPDGASCNNDVECASDVCTNGACQPQKARVEIDGDCSGGAPCVADATCQDGICVETASACAPLLAACAMDDDCCSGACDTEESGQCTGSAGVCAAEGVDCEEDSDCCEGRCDFGVEVIEGRGVCTTTCKAYGETCVGGDCCDGYCDFEMGQCLDCLEPTINEGHTCTSNADCCGEMCVGAGEGLEGACYACAGTPDDPCP